MRLSTTVADAMKRAFGVAVETDLLARAREKGADEDVQRTLEQLPDRYRIPAEVSEELGKLQ